MNGSDYRSLRSDHPADHYVRQALDEQQQQAGHVDDWARDARVDDQADEDVA